MKGEKAIALLWEILGVLKQMQGIEKKVQKEKGIL